MRFLKLGHFLVVAGITVVMLTVGSIDAVAQKRGNKGGEVRGKDRAEQVKEMNEEKEKKAKKGKKSKKGKKGKKGKK